MTDVSYPRYYSMLSIEYISIKAKIMKELLNKYLIWILYLLLATGINTYGQTQGCNFKPGNITLTLAGQTQAPTVVSYVVLLDANNIITYKSTPNNTTLYNVRVGGYQAASITYDMNQSIIPNIEVGSDFNNLEHCLKSNTVDLSVCDCNTYSSTITVPPANGINPQYVLTNGRGIIQAISTSTTFNNLTNDVYNLYVVCGNGSISNLTIGGKITNIAASNFCMPNPLPYIICTPDCVPLCVPISVVRTRTR